MQIARELEIHVEPVPLESFIPLPDGSAERSIRIGQFGNLEIHVADPYSIALSKLDRGFETDFEDIIFLIRRNFITLNELERIAQDALPHAREYDLQPDILDHLQELKDRVKLPLEIVWLLPSKKDAVARAFLFYCHPSPNRSTAFLSSSSLGWV